MVSRFHHAAGGVANAQSQEESDKDKDTTKIATTLAELAALPTSSIDVLWVQAERTLLSYRNTHYKLRARDDPEVRAAEAAVRTAEGTAAYRDAAEHSKTTRKNALVGRQRRGSTTVARSEDNPGAGLFGAAEPDAASATRAAADQYISATQNQWLKSMRTLGIFEEEADDITRLLRAAQDFMTRKDRLRAQRQKGEAGSAVSNASPSVFCPQQHSPDTPQPHHTQRILPDSCNGHRQPWIA